MAVTPTIEQNKPETPPVDPSVLAAEAEAARTSRSKGERIFDWLTYGGIGFLGVFAAGIPFAYWAKYGKGANMFHGSSQYLQKMGMGAKSAEDAVMTSVLMQPGNLALIPIKIMENNKPHIVDKINDMLGEKSSDASVEQDPKQTWGSLIKGRLAAWLAVFMGFRGAALAVGDKNFSKFENAFAEYVVCWPLGKPTHIPGMAKIVENETKLFRYGKIASLDVFATAAATTLLYMASRFFAKKNQTWESKHTHLRDPSQAFDLEKAKEKPKETAIEQTSMMQGLDAMMDTPKLFTDSVEPKEPAERKPKPRPESFAEAVASKKTLTNDTSPGVSA